MARAPTGQIIERPGEHGITYALRVRFAGRRHYVTTAAHNRAEAEDELANVQTDIRRGVWEPPRREVVERYVEKTGRKVDDFRFYEVYGLFRLAVIAQQIYFRYHHKETHNPAFKNFWVFAHYLAWRCKKLITRYA